MLEKEEEARREIEEKLKEIRENHAAKIIQKAWRKHDRILKSDPKKKPKGKQFQQKKNSLKKK